MVKVIMGLKGSGKTKQLIELVTEALEKEHGDVVCMEKGPVLTYDIPYQARLIQTSDYNFGTFEFFKGFLSGLRAGNYDITDVFIDSLYKMVENHDDKDVDDFLTWLDAFGQKENINFTITLTVGADQATEVMKKYL